MFAVLLSDEARAVMDLDQSHFGHVREESGSEQIRLAVPLGVRQRGALGNVRDNILRMRGAWKCSPAMPRFQRLSESIPGNNTATGFTTRIMNKCQSEYVQ